jgi:hypothetical protein
MSKRGFLRRSLAWEATATDNSLSAELDPIQSPEHANCHLEQLDFILAERETG